jgi:SAM-dependent methyltransferase
MNPPTPYDLVTYPSYTHPQTHPDRLAVIARLFGMNPAPVPACRVLELGCGTGSNLIPLAAVLPQSRFLGIDLAAKPVAEGQASIASLGLENIRLEVGDVQRFPAKAGQFDYIIAHGLYSWVPEAARQAVLRLCRRHLAPHGVAYISYNAYPGGHLRVMLSEMMQFHVRGFAEPRERIRQARALAGLLAGAAGSDDAYSVWMAKELERTRTLEDEHLFHDDLAEINQPFYFREFVEQAAGHQLQYLGEADFFEMSCQIFEPPVRQTLQELGSNRILQEQYMDFLKCRRFRQTLLCHREVRIVHPPAGSQLESMIVASAVNLVDQPGTINDATIWIFELPRGAKCQTDYPAGKVALALLGEIYPAGVEFDTLWERVEGRLREAKPDGDPGDRGKLADFLLSLYGGGVIELRTWSPPVVSVPGEHPQVPSWIRWQASRGDTFASLLHHPVRVEDEVGRNLVRWLDGTQNRATLKSRLWEFIQSKGVVTGPEAPAREELERHLEKNLRQLGRMGLLIA